jgi:hypothetical protein
MNQRHNRTLASEKQQEEQQQPFHHQQGLLNDSSIMAKNASKTIISSLNVTAITSTTYTSNSKKPLLIFKHYPKAGGGSIEMLLRELKTFVYQQQQFRYLCLPSSWDVLHNMTVAQTGKKKCQFQQQLVDWNDTLVIIPEFSKVSPKDHEKGFVISSIREPCDQYISLWSYGSNQVGYMYNKFLQKYPNWTLQAYGQDPPTFDSPRDIHAFRNIWLKDDKVKGEMTRRFHQSFGRLPHKNKNTSTSSMMMMPSVVDCWVYVDDFQATLYTCLREYENQGGHVNWDAPLLSALVEKLQQERYSNRQLLKENEDKNDPIHNPQVLHHSNCSKYFDEETSNLVRNDFDAIVYNVFGYESCCGGRITFGKNIIFPPRPVSLSNMTMGVEGQNQSNVGVVFQNNSTLTIYNESSAMEKAIVLVDDGTNDKVQDIDNSNPLLLFASVAIFIAFALVACWSKNILMIWRRIEGNEKILLSVSYSHVSLQQDDTTDGGEDKDSNDESESILSGRSAQMD